MPNRKKKNNPHTIGARSRQEIDPLISRSARLAELSLDTTRIPEQPSTSISGVVRKIIRSPRASQPETAQIVMNVPDKQSRYLHIENTLIDEDGDDVKLKKGARVVVTVTAQSGNS
jgi:hypothetical protein